MDPIRSDGIDFDLIVNVPVIFHAMAMMEKGECTDREGVLYDDKRTRT